MDDITNKCLSEEDNTEPERTDMKELVELPDTPVRHKVTEDKDNDSPRNENVEEVPKSSVSTTEDLGMQLWTNHIIMRQIMSHLDWREQVPCELVCRLWRDAVKSLQRVNLHSYDFMMQLRKSEAARYNISLHVSNLPVQTRPLCAISFCDTPFLTCTLPCEDFSPAPCDPPCAYAHNEREAVDAIMPSKRSCLLTVDAPEMIYIPPPTSHIFRHITYGMLTQAIPLLGLCLPELPNVNCRSVQYRSERTVQEDFCSVVDDICATDIIKGVVVFVKSKVKIENKYLRRLLNYIKNKQPSIPYALGGLRVWQVMNKSARVNEDYGVTICVFSVLKEAVSRCQFNIYSLVIDSALEEKAAIQEAVQTFAGNISKLEFSASLQLSCFSRQRRFPLEQKLIHTSCLTVEQEVFRAAFPDTSVVGCYGNGVIGHSHPDIRPPPTELTERSSDAESELRHFMSTVFVYFTWGKQPVA